MIPKKFLTQSLNVFHFQDSCGSGRTCSIMLRSIEDELAELSPLASVTLVYPNDAFDKDTPPTSKVPRVEMSKEAMGELGLLDAEGYVKRQTLILNKDGKILAKLLVNDESELPMHIKNQVLPELRKLSTTK